jgi:hypothetical protein
MSMTVAMRVADNLMKVTMSAFPSLEHAQFLRSGGAMKWTAHPHFVPAQLLQLQRL